MRPALLALPVLALSTPAQAEDLQTWLEAKLALEPAKRLELSVAPQVRLQLDDPRQLSAAMVDLGVEYGPTRWLALGLTYRPSYERDGDEALVTRHRLAADLMARLDLGDLRLGYRLRLTEKYRPDANNQWKATLRNLVSVTWRGWEDWRPKASAELYVGLDDFDQAERDTLRLTVGTEYALTERQSIEVFYRVETLHADEDTPTLHILGLGWGFDLDLRDDG